MPTNSSNVDNLSMSMFDHESLDLFNIGIDFWRVQLENENSLTSIVELSNLESSQVPLFKSQILIINNVQIVERSYLPISNQIPLQISQNSLVLRDLNTNLFNSN